VEQLINSLKEFFSTGKTYDLEFRINQLKILKHALEEFEEDLYSALFLDLNKSKEESFLTEIFIVYREIKYFIKNLKKLSKPKRVKVGIENKSGKGFLIPEPYGVTLIISPWNYPVNLTLTPLVGAIAAGNCAVLKPSEYSENVTKVLEKMITKYFSEDYIKVVTGDAEISKKLLDQDFDYIFFTGSPGVGKYVMKKASERLIPVTLELGGKNPTIVDSTCDLELSAKRIAWGKLLNAGQTCISPDYLIVEESIKEQLVERLIKYFEDFQSKMACIINDRHVKRLKNFLNNTKGRVIFGGKVYERKFEPTIVDDVKINDSLMSEEIFGPILPIITFKDEKDIFEIISKNPYPLSLYVFSNNKAFVKNVINKIQAGGISVNDTISHFVPESFPFGGIKTSGIGRYHGRYSFETFSHFKPVFFRGKFEINVKYPPYKGFEKIQKMLRKWYL
jgi:aldehyde dehydrogenase (NAD+)